MMPQNLSSRFDILKATLRLLYRSHPRAFIIGAVSSLAEPLFFPALILLLQQLLQRLTTLQGNTQFATAVIPVGIALLVLMLTQRIGIIVRDVANTILRQEAWVVISKQIMQKLPSVPYSLFENNAFQARYGLVIREASHRSITLVDSLLSTAPILLGLLGLVVSLFSIAPFMVMALLVIAIPATLIERRFSRAMYALEEHSAPMQLRIEALTNMQVDATWQRDVRVYHSNLLGREHAALSELYLARLKQVTMRFFGLRSAAALVQVIGLGLALTAALALMSQGQMSLANFVVFVPGIPILSGMISSFIYQMRSLLESLRYAQTLFEFLSTKFDENGLLSSAAASQVDSVQKLTAIQLENVSYTYPENQKTALSDISCTFKPGLTAIVRTNGAGKSTLVQLVAGLLPPSAPTLYTIR